MVVRAEEVGLRSGPSKGQPSPGLFAVCRRVVVPEWLCSYDRPLRHRPERADHQASRCTRFGKPQATGDAEGRQYDRFCYHGKVSENFRAGFLVLVSVETLWISDFYLVPCELGRACWMPLWGYEDS